ncbi:MAG: putative Dynein heavy chain, partial [Streblomastix strix]
ANAIIATRSRRWCLMIDPQKQANRWVKNLWKERGIRIVKPHDSTLMRTMENGVRVGVPVLLENAGETFEPALTPILNKSITRAGGRLTIRIGDQDVDYSEDFSLQITTTLPNPHYTAEISIATTIINFTVTPSGLDEQLLAETVRIERPELEAQRDSLIVQAAKDADDTSKVEDDILNLLSSVSGSILDNEDVIQALDKSKEIAEEIQKRAEETKQTTDLINAARDQYRDVSRRGSLIYFVIADMANADPMYQFSLAFFISLFSKCIKDCRKQKNSDHDEAETDSDRSDQIETQYNESDIKKHVDELVDVITKTVFANVCRGLFERDKQIFSFLITAQIARDRGIMSTEEWRLFLLGNAAIVKTNEDEDQQSSGRSGQPSDKPSFLKDAQWELINELEKFNVPRKQKANSQSNTSPDNQGKQQNATLELDYPYRGISFSMISQHAANAWEDWINSPKPEEAPLPQPWARVLNDFQRLVILRCLREERVVFAVRLVVDSQLGTFYSDPPPFDIKETFASSDSATPVVFILSPGTDPASMLRQFAAESGSAEKLVLKSLGQGQGPITERLIEKGKEEGLWVCLQNCHLCTSWMPSLDAIVEKLSAGSSGAPATKQQTTGGKRGKEIIKSDYVHPDFRLFLTSMPSKAFPVAVLQTSIKVTNEPPRGLRVNLQRSMMSFAEHFDDHPDPLQRVVWKRLLFGLGFFHAVIQERRKYGPLGWNIMYDWTLADLDVSRELLLEYLGGKHEGDENQQGDKVNNEGQENEIDQDEDDQEGDQQDGNEKNKKKRRRKEADLDFDDETGPDLDMNTIPFKALAYIVGEISYGGRVTDVWDMRSLEAIFKLFFCPEFLQPHFNITSDGTYTVPRLGMIDYEEMELFVHSLPVADTPEVFGLHANADITYQQRESRFLLSTIVTLQPNISAPPIKKNNNEAGEEEEEDDDEEEIEGDEQKDSQEEEQEEEEQEQEDEEKEETDGDSQEKKNKKKRKKKKNQQKKKQKTVLSVPSSDEIVTSMCRTFASRIPKSIDFSKAHSSITGILPKKSMKKQTQGSLTQLKVQNNQQVAKPNEVQTELDEFGNPVEGNDQNTRKIPSSETAQSDASNSEALKNQQIEAELLAEEELARKFKEAAQKNSLNIVLQQETVRFNRLLNVIHQSLSDLKAAVQGFVVMSESLEGMHQSFLIAQVPAIWANVAYPSLKSLGSWIDDLIVRVNFLEMWIENGAPNSFLLPGFFFPQGFLTGILQMHSRKTQIPIDTLIFRCHVEDQIFRSEEDDMPNKGPITGVYVHGLFLEGARWDNEEHVISESERGILSVQMPMLWLEPVVRGTAPITDALNTKADIDNKLQDRKISLQQEDDERQAQAEDIAHEWNEEENGKVPDELGVIVTNADVINDGENSSSLDQTILLQRKHQLWCERRAQARKEIREQQNNDRINSRHRLCVYDCPLYKTQARYGVLSTTGHSTNFVFAVSLPTYQIPQHWVRRGVALQCAVEN